MKYHKETYTYKPYSEHKKEENMALLKIIVIALAALVLVLIGVRG